MASSGPVGDHIAGHSLHGLQVLLQGALQPGLQQRLHTKCSIISRSMSCCAAGWADFLYRKSTNSAFQFFPPFKRRSHRFSAGFIDLYRDGSIDV